MTRTGALPPHAAEPTGVWSSKPFRRLWLAVSLSGLGLWLSVPALAASAAAAADGGPAAQARSAGLVLAVMALPAVLLAPLAGTAAARLDARVLLTAADALRFALVLSVPLVGAAPWTVVAAFLVALLALPWTAVPDAAVPALIGADRQDDELRGRARRAVLRAAFGAAPVAAVLFTVLALIARAADLADLPLYATAVVFLGAAASVALLRDLRGSGAPGTAPWPLLLVVRGVAAPRGLFLAAAAAALTTAAIAAVAVGHAREMGGGAAGFGSVLIGLTVGLAAGIFLGPRVLGPFSRARLLGLAVVAAALLLIVVALVRDLVVVVFVTSFMSVAAGMAWSTAAGLAGEPTDEQAAAPARLRAVALVTGLVAVAVLPPLAAALGDNAIGSYELAGTGAALLIAAVPALLAGVLAYRRLDDRRGIPLLPDLLAALRGEVYTPPSRGAERAAAPRNRGVFIAFEGGEGAGKTTQARLAAIWLRDHGYDVVTTHEPGATKIGMRLRAMLLDKQNTGLSARAETLLYAADRADHVANVIRPALERGAIVVSDRYVDSSLAYQGYGRRQPVDEIARVNAWATEGLVPDLTVLLEVPPDTGLGRLASPADRMESEPREFHERVREGFRALADADPGRYLVVDASLPQNEISRLVQDRIREILPDPVPAGTEEITSTFPAITDI
ncbi:dTMP kinase [Actinomadura keratinilytica]|jgi:dTMP kinase|uniref:dTMP kinase n=1 Tax=Actinomadura keratinilytica TaxID=547461 RepID=UPI00360C37CC